MDHDAILRVLRRELEAAPDGLVAAWLYGSVARGEAGPKSDIDIALLYAADPPRVLDSPPARIEDRLERALGLPVEVVVQNRAPVDLIQRVLRDGILLLERDRSARIAFEVKSRNEYWDLKPILDLYRRGGRATG